MSTDVDETRAKLLEKVRGLIAKADSTEFPEEADAFRTKANALMLRYSINEWDLKDPEKNKRIITTRDIDMAWYSTNPHAEELWAMMQRVAIHCRVVLVYWQYTGLIVPGVGTEADLDYFDLLFTNIMLEMSNGLEPKPKRSQSMIENLVMMKEAGMKWERIGELLMGVGQLDDYNRNVGVKFTKLYTDYCIEHNRPRLRVQPSTFQHSFAVGFAAQMKDRLFKIQQESRALYDANTDAQSTDLVLADIKKIAETKAYELFGYPPRQSGGYGRRDNRKVDVGGMQAGRAAANNVNLGAASVQRGVAGQIGGGS